MSQQVIDVERDQFISDEITDAIGRLTEVRESRTPVSFMVENGVVTVSGVTFTETLRRRILHAIAMTPGVTKVIDRLVDDEDLRFAVAQALTDAAALGTGEPDVSVASYQGVVSLTGRISNAEKQQAAVNTASKVAGVREVLDRMEVRS